MDSQSECANRVGYKVNWKSVFAVNLSVFAVKVWICCKIMWNHSECIPGMSSTPKKWNIVKRNLLFFAVNRLACLSFLLLENILCYIPLLYKQIFWLFFFIFWRLGFKDFGLQRLHKYLLISLVHLLYNLEMVPLNLKYKYQTFTITFDLCSEHILKYCIPNYLHWVDHIDQEEIITQAKTGKGQIYDMIN